LHKVKKKSELVISREGNCFKLEEENQDRLCESLSFSNVAIQSKSKGKITNGEKNYIV